MFSSYIIMNRFYSTWKSIFTCDNRKCFKEPKEKSLKREVIQSKLYSLFVYNL